MSNLRVLDPAFDNFEGALRRFFPATLFEPGEAPLKMRIDEAKAQAKYADGVLTLELPKKAPAPSSKIAIQ